jgi:Tol biopolymer transport system component
MVSFLFQFDSRFSISGTLERVSEPQAAGSSDTYEPDISADGRYVAFTTTAGGLVAGDAPDTPDVFVRDLETGVLQLVSAGLDGSPVGDAGAPSISGDGRFVAFHSSSDALIDRETSQSSDVYVRDRLTGSTELISVDAEGGPANATSYGPTLSDDGSSVAFHSYAEDLAPLGHPGVRDVFVRDRDTGTTSLASVGVTPTAGQHEYGRDRPAISADGRFVAFCSRSALVGADTDDRIDVYRRDIVLGATELVSTAAGAPALDHCEPSLSADGRHVAFSSQGAGVSKRDMLAGPPYPVDRSTDGRLHGGSSPVISGDGRYVAFVSDEDFPPYEDNVDPDVYVRDTVRGVLSLLSASPPGTEFLVMGSPGISADGARVAFTRDAGQGGEVFVFTTQG